MLFYISGSSNDDKPYESLLEKLNLIYNVKLGGIFLQKPIAHFGKAKEYSLEMKSRRKWLWDYLGRCRLKQTRRNLVRNVIAWIVVVTARF